MLARTGSAATITNANFLCEDNGKRFFVRIGDDIAEHGVMRFNEIAASRAAAAAQVSPPVVHVEPGAMVLEFIEGRTLSETDIADSANLAGIVDLVVFQVIRTYARRLRDANSTWASDLDTLLGEAEMLETATGPVTLAFGHNDLLAANFMHDGERLWLIDWDYAGFNSPLFDLGGLASNNGLNEDLEQFVLERYFGATPDAQTWRAYGALKCASLLRETMWSMVSEIHSTLDFDYAAYTRENLDKYRQSVSAFGL